MTRKIVIETDEFEVEATLLEDDRPETCDAVWEALPFEGKASQFKEEIYFDIPVDIGPEDATPNTEQGDVSFWPEGPAFCVFYGDSQPVSPVNTFARIGEDIEKFEGVQNGDLVKVRKA